MNVEAMSAIQTLIGNQWLKARRRLLTASRQRKPGTYSVKRGLDNCYELS
jgi:hypothetical protein